MKKSAIEEVVYNALDAEAKNVNIVINMTNLTFEVKDDGVDELAAIQTFGYRGESLASIAAVASLEIASTVRPASSSNPETNVKVINFSADDGIKTLATPLDVGTLVKVRDIFRNCQVRRQNVNVSALRLAIRKRIESIALSHIHVRFVLWDEARSQKLLSTPTDHQFLTTFSLFHGEEKANILEHVSSDDSIDASFRLRGYLSLPNKKGAPNRSLQLFFLNHRIIINTKLHRQVNQLYQKYRLFNAERVAHANSSKTKKELIDVFPIFVLFLECPMSEYERGFEPSSKTFLEFKNWKRPVNVINSVLTKFLTVNRGDEDRNAPLKLTDHQIDENNDEEAVAWQADTMDNDPSIATEVEEREHHEEIVESQEDEIIDVDAMDATTVVTTTTTIKTTKTVITKPLAPPIYTPIKIESPTSPASVASTPIGLRFFSDTEQNTPTKLSPSPKKKQKSSKFFGVSDNTTTNASTSPSTPPNKKSYDVHRSPIEDNLISKPEDIINLDTDSEDEKEEEFKRKSPKRTLRFSLQDHVHHFDKDEAAKQAGSDEPQDMDTTTDEASAKTLQTATLSTDQPKDVPTDNVSKEFQFDHVHGAGCNHDHDHKMKVEDEEEEDEEEDEEESMIPTVTKQTMFSVKPEIISDDESTEEESDEPIKKTTKVSSPTKTDPIAMQRYALSQNMFNFATRVDVAPNIFFQQSNGHPAVTSVSVTPPTTPPPAAAPTAQEIRDGNRSYSPFFDVEKQKNEQSTWTPPLMPGALVDHIKEIVSKVQEVTVSRELLNDFRFITQWDKKFLICEAGGMLFVLDQHAVSERIKLETLEKRYLTDAKYDVYEMPSNTRWSLTPHEMALVRSFSRNLDQWGFRVRTNEATITVETVPMFCLQSLGINDLREFLYHLENSGGSNSTKPPAAHRILASKACRTAIKFGHQLTHKRCTDLLEELSKCNIPFQCAHCGVFTLYFFEAIYDFVNGQNKEDALGDDNITPKITSYSTQLWEKIQKKSMLAIRDHKPLTANQSLQT
eukprot:gene6756-7853_t